MSFLSRFSDKISKKYAIRLLSNDSVERVPVIKTRCLGLDHALRCNGIPRGRIIELFGNESSGKTTLALFIAGAFIKAGGSVLYIDAEHALNIDYVRNLGIDASKMALSQPDSMEEATDIALEGIEYSGKDDKLLVVIDSVASLSPRAELERGMDKDTIGLQARLMGKFMRKCKSLLNSKLCTLICINQTRMKIGVFWGNPVDTPGGKALKFFSSIRMEVNRIKYTKVGNRTTGIRSRIKIVKNKIGCPFYTTEIEIVFGKGIDYVMNTYETLAFYKLLNGMDVDDIEKIFRKPKKIKRLRKELSKK